MIRFNNDYNCGAHPNIINALASTNNESYGGYGIDVWCERAKNEIKKYIEKDCDIHFLIGGTQVNFTVISAALRPYQSVISADTGHINVHETGAVENCGHKIISLKSENGKINAEQIAEQGELYYTSEIKEHVTQPKMVYISFPTEYGTIYTKSELEAIHEICQKYNMYLFVDGARLAYGLAAPDCDVTLKDISEYADVFYIGGTKCGAMFGEAVVILNNELKTDFRSYIKQNGAMLAKGWLLGIQFYELFKDGLYFEIGKRANKFALKIKKAFNERQIPSYIESSTNQQFVVVENKAMDKLAQKYVFEFEARIDDSHSCVRFCTSWSTKEEDVEELLKDINIL